MIQDALSYDPSLDQYKVGWKTDRNWRGCRKLIVRFKDGVEQKRQLPVPVEPLRVENLPVGPN